MERFKIFPSIGIARLGKSPDHFFLCPEQEDSLGIELDDTGNETPVEKFKDSNGLIKRQGARFKVLELDDASGEYRPLVAGATIEWKVRLANKKAGVVRPSNPPTQPPQVPLQLKPNSGDLIIDPGEKSISGSGQSGLLFDGGKYKTENVFLGELKTDMQGNLIVLGGRGESKSPSNEDIEFYYFTDDWYDDTSDGYVKATVKLPDGTEAEAADGWVIVGPPDFAPGVKGLVTLYDIMEQVAADQGQIPPPAEISYFHHVKPLIDRFKNLKWVSEVTDFSVPFAESELNSTAAADRAKRRTIRNKILNIENTLAGHTNGTPFRLTGRQKSILDNWRDGTFSADNETPPPTSLSAADKLIKTVLDTTVGQGFCPGIEGGIIVQNRLIYSEPFRFDTSKIAPGDITALMALPWQADFLECNTNWWPSQRPDKVKLGNGSKALWARNFPPDNPHEFLIENLNKLGFVKPHSTPAGQEMIEEERNDL